MLVEGHAVVIGARAFDVLLSLIERGGRLVSKHELLDAAWPGLDVEENNVAVQVGALRKVLGAAAIATIPGRGYRITAPFEPESGVDSSASSGSNPPSVSVGAGRPGTDGLPITALPALSRLIGRGQELQALRALVVDHRIVTVVGAGGVGKTHLVRHLLQSSSESGSDRGWFVDLSQSTQDASASVPHSVAAAFGIQLGSGDALASLARAVTDITGVLVLDNAEHVLESVARLTASLTAATRRLRVVITSQAPLAIAGERVFRIAGLSVPEVETDGVPAHFGAIDLFVERASAADRRFRLTTANSATIADICRRLDGQPLAIELAAARTATLGVQGVAAALHQRFRVLTGGRRFAPERQQTLLATLEWSHGLLSPIAQVVYRRLGIFVGSVALATALEVAADDSIDEWAVLDALTDLVDRSLVTPTEDEPPRYLLLDTPRAYAKDRLRAAAEEESLQRRRAAALRDRFVRAHGDWLNGRVGADVYRREVAPDLADGTAALAWAAAHAPTDAVALAPCLDWAMVNEPGARRRALWDSTRSLLDALVPPRLRCRWWAGWYHWAVLVAGHSLEKMGAEGIDDVRQCGDASALYAILRASVWSLTGSPYASAAAGDATERCLMEMRALEDPSWPAALRYWRARAESEHCHAAGDYVNSIHWFETAIRLAAESGDSRGRLSAMVALSDARLSLGQCDAAARELEALIDELEPSRYESTLTHARNNLVLAYLRQRNYDGARRVAARAWPLATRFSITGVLASNLALLFALEERYEAEARCVGYVECQDVLLGRDHQSNEERSVREAQAAAVAALGPDHYARLAAEGRRLTEAELGRLVAP